MQKRRFTKEFEAEAVRLLQTSGRTQLEDDLGIGLSTLVRWVGRSRDRLIDEPPKPGSEDVAAELKRLRREPSCSNRMTNGPSRGPDT
jgi:transposase